MQRSLPVLVLASLSLSAAAQAVMSDSGLLAFSLSRDAILKALNASKPLGSQFLNNTQIGNITVSPQLTLYDINCSLENSDLLNFDVEFYNASSQIWWWVGNGQVFCGGLYSYDLSAVVPGLVISDKWDLNI